MIKALLRYICGTLTVKVKGGGCERFLNLVYGSKIKIWNLRRVDETTMTFCIRCGDFRKLRFAVVRSHVKYILSKNTG